jgi:hypothetical protein
MADAHNEGADVSKMALVAVFCLIHLELDKVAIVAVVSLILYGIPKM